MNAYNFGNDGSLERLQYPSSKVMAVDTETISLANKTCIGIGVAYSPTEAYYVPILPETSPMVGKVMELIADKSMTKVYHNANFDVEVLRQLSKAEGLPTPDVWNIDDTSIMANVSGKRVALEKLGRDELNAYHLHTIQDLVDKHKNDTGAKKVNMLDLPQDWIAHKCANDVVTTFALRDKLLPKMVGTIGDCYNVDLRLFSFLKVIEQKGLAIRHEALQSHRTNVQRELLAYRDQFDKLGFNPASPQQVGYVLSGRGNILPFSNGGRKLVTNEEALSKLDDPLAQLILAFRRANKLKGTYIDPWVEADRAYTHFRLDLSTGRLASYDRNLQNIPEIMRDIFAPDSEEWTYGDMSQVELRVLSYLSGDRVLGDAFTSGEDPHWITQQKLYPGTSRDNKSIRTRTKTFTYAMTFLAVAETLAEHTGEPVEKCRILRQEWLDLYSGAARYMVEVSENKALYSESLYGRKMLLPRPEDLVVDRNWTWQKSVAHVKSCRVNYPVQGSAADLIKRAMLYLLDNKGWADEQRLQVHDEVLLDGYHEWPKELEYIHPELHTPFEVEHSAFWK